MKFEMDCVGSVGNDKQGGSMKMQIGQMIEMAGERYEVMDVGHGVIRCLSNNGEYRVLEL